MYNISEMKKEMIIVSACLVGIPCRYDGSAKPCERVIQLVSEGGAIPVCPEQLGGLPTPRPAAEKRDGRIVGLDGTDFTNEFVEGAKEAIKLANLVGAKKAILKSKSPTCGSGEIYDGTFSGTVIEGDGIFAEMCKRQGIEVETEKDI